MVSMLLSQTQLKTAEVPTRRQLDQSRTGDLETLRGGEPFASLAGDLLRDRAGLRLGVALLLTDLAGLRL